MLEEFGPLVWRIIGRLIGDTVRQREADDCFQEVFLAALDVEARSSQGQPVRNRGERTPVELFADAIASIAADLATVIRTSVFTPLTAP